MATQQPTYQAYSVSKRESQDDFWLCIGAAFPHADGRGLNVVLQALPLDGKIVLRPPRDDKEEQPQQPQRRDNNRSRR
ncbi:hypothetical protein EAS56_17610 [Bradyrhizobium guangzhouense]|uniref:Uncharacterized protein n=1 Tax=Bradyrhizobium guangzhouense TaxID=1325095 RepID=A0ABY0E4W9_9BRAD|nr:hypothetical protein EAS56_17610 [Bradyrhizobium guangzhouense]